MDLYFCVIEHDVIVAAKSKIEQVAMQLEERRKAKVRNPQNALCCVRETHSFNRKLAKY